MVLYDNLAVARDQGLIAALHLRQLASIKDPQNTKKVTPVTPAEVKTIPSEMLLNTEKLNSASEKFYRKKMIAEMVNTILQSTYPSVEGLKEQKSHVSSLQQAIELNKTQVDIKYNSRGTVIHNRTERKVDFQEAKLHAFSDSRVNKSASRFTKHIKMKELLAFNATIDAENVKIEAILNKVLIATADHAQLLKTMEASVASNPRHLISTLIILTTETISILQLR